ncbi:MAG: putative glutamine amidotransferase [Pseudohongiellaceae bacterium]|jgi:putative glutamine amidotransferase
MRPLIGVTCSADESGQPIVRAPYVQALHRAGALPVALPFVSSADEAASLLQRLDGVVLTGSEDLDPSLWAEPLHPLAEVMHPARQQTEMLLCRELLQRPLPLLGICGGMQNLAVAAGGTIHQHLPDLGSQILEHSVPWDGPRHAIHIEADSILAECLGQTAATNSAHHQGVAELPQSMIVTARSSDGVIEAFELAGRPFAVCVQWHPERMVDDAGQAQLFSRLVQACAS